MPDLDALLAQIDESFDDLIALEEALVRIPSVNTGVMPTGNETPVAELARDWLGADGIEAEILERAPGRGNLIARINGTSDKAGLLFMSHLDVVPVEDESKWRFPPFSATIADGRLYGRGAFDCKGLLAAQMMAMRILARNGVTLQDGLILASGADEEHGGRYGFGWLAREHPDKIAAPFAVNEGGGTPLTTGGVLTYTLGVGEKGRLQVEIEVKGDSAHASVPWLGANAMYRLAQVISRIEAYEPELDTSAAFFDYLPSLAIEHRVTPENIDAVIEEVGGKNRSVASMMKGHSRMTLTPTMVRGGVKSNSVPESACVTCDIRALPHQDLAYVEGELRKTLDGVERVTFEIDHMAVSNASPFDTEFAQRIKAATERTLGSEVQMIPAISTGFTDSRFLRPLGTVAYGFAGSHPEEDGRLIRAHGTDESISLKSLRQSARVMLALAYDMLAVR